MSLRTPDEIRHHFTAVKLEPKTFVHITKFSKNFLALALLIGRDVPDSKQRAIALQKLLEAKQAVIQAITHHKKRETT